MERTKTALPAVVIVRAAAADALNLPADRLYKLVETEIAFPGDFAVISHGLDRRFARITEEGAQIETGHLQPAEYLILGRAIPLEPYGQQKT